VACSEPFNAGNLKTALGLTRGLSILPNDSSQHSDPRLEIVLLFHVNFGCFYSSNCGIGERQRLTIDESNFCS